MRPYSNPSSTYDDPKAGKGVLSIPIQELKYKSSTSDEFEISLSSSDIKIDLLTITNDGDYEIFQEINILNNEPFILDFENKSGKPRYYDRFTKGYSYANRSQINASKWSFGIHTKYVNEWNEYSDALESLITKFEIRKPIIEIDMSNPY